MKPKMPKPSQQLVFSAIASVLAMSALALSSHTLGTGADAGEARLAPLQAGIEMPGLPSLPALLPR